MKISASESKPFQSRTTVEISGRAPPLQEKYSISIFNSSSLVLKKTKAQKRIDRMKRTEQVLKWAAFMTV